MRVVELSALAKRDLDSIWLFIAQDNFDAAGRVQDEIMAEALKLADFPGMGHTRPDAKNAEYRFWKVYSYLIVYVFDETTLSVLRVIHGARDIGSILG